MTRHGRRPDDERSKEEGFTLLEALVALTVLSLVGVSALGVIGSDLRAASRAREGLTADAVAEEILGRIDLLDGPSLGALPDSLRRGEMTVNGEKFAWKSTASDRPEDPALVTVLVTVTSDEGTRTLTTIRRKEP